MTDEQIKRQILSEKRRKKNNRRLIAVCISLILAIVCGHLLGRFIGSRDFLVRVPKDPEFVSTAEDVPIVSTGIAQVGNEGGEKFWSWYGFDSRVEWCACFASWCENELGYLDSGDAPKFALVSDGANWFSDKGQWKDAGSIPAAGDLIFFDWNQNEGLDHVGIVTAVVDDKVFTIEGNSSDRCRVKRYKLDDPVISGYGHITTES